MVHDYFNREAYINAIRRAYKNVNYYKPAKTFSRKRHTRVHSEPSSYNDTASSGDASLLKSKSVFEWDRFKDKIKKIKEIASRIEGYPNK